MLASVSQKFTQGILQRRLSAEVTAGSKSSNLSVLDLSGHDESIKALPLTQDVGNSSTELDSDDDVVQLRQELAALRREHVLKHQEVNLLQSQVQRLSNFLDDSSKSEIASHEIEQHLQQQLQATLSELEHSRGQLDQLATAAQQHQTALASTSAARQASDHRVAVLKLVVADMYRELQSAQQLLQEAERRGAAAQQQAADRAEDCETMKAALSAAHTHILSLSTQHQEQHQQQHKQLQQAEANRQDPQVDTVSTRLQDSSADQHLQQLLQQTSKQQLLLMSQAQQLESLNGLVKELSAHLALKHDSMVFAERRAELLEQQLQAAKQQLEDAATAAAAMVAAQAAPLPRHSCSSIPEEPANASAPHEAQPQQQQQRDEGHLHNSLSAGPSPGLASLAAALSQATSGFSISSPWNDSEQQQQAQPQSQSQQQQQQQQQPQRQQSPQPPLSPFAMARNFVANREADLVARLKDELRDRERQVAQLTADNSRYATQLQGLQTLVTAKIAQCNRLDKEARQLDKQLKQAAVAASADHEALGQQLTHLSERVVDLQEQLEASRQRGQQLETQLAAVRAKLSQVLQALVDDAAALQHHQPASYHILAQDVPAAMAQWTGSGATTPTKTEAVSTNGNSDTNSNKVSLGPQPVQAPYLVSGCQAAQLSGFPLAAAAAVAAAATTVVATVASSSDTFGNLAASEAPAANSTVAGSTGVAAKQSGVEGLMPSPGSTKQRPGMKLFEALRLGKKASKEVDEVEPALGAMRRSRTRSGESGLGYTLVEMASGQLS